MVSIVFTFNYCTFYLITVDVNYIIKTELQKHSEGLHYLDLGSYKERVNQVMSEYIDCSIEKLKELNFSPPSLLLIMVYIDPANESFEGATSLQN